MFIYFASHNTTAVYICRTYDRIGKMVELQGQRHSRQVGLVEVLMTLG